MTDTEAVCSAELRAIAIYCSLKYLAHLELRDVIFKIADDLYSENGF